MLSIDVNLRSEVNSRRADLAQLVEHFIRNERVTCSNHVVGLPLHLFTPNFRDYPFESGKVSDVVRDDYCLSDLCLSS